MNTAVIEYKSDVFISYSRKDYLCEDGRTVDSESIISKALRVFDDIGISYWLDKEGIEIGDDYTIKISTAIKESRVFVFFSSVNSNATDAKWPRREVAFADDMNKIIIPFKVDLTPYHDAINLRLSDLEYADYESGGDKAFEPLVKIVHQKLQIIKAQEEAAEEETKTRREQKEHQRRLEIARIENEGKLAVLQEMMISLKERREAIINEMIKCGIPISINAEEDSYMIDLKSKYENALEQASRMEADFCDAQKRVEFLEKSLEESERKCMKYERDLEENKKSFIKQTQKIEHMRKDIIHNVELIASLRSRIHKLLNKNLVKKTFFANSVSFEMVFIKGDSNAYFADRRKSGVKDFYIAQYPVVQELWREVMGTDPSVSQDNIEGNSPVENVSWNECQRFLSKLNRITGLNFRLPYVCEWEFAAKGGLETNGYQYSGSNLISDVAWYKSNRVPPQPVGMKNPNELGLYDMSGNVYEWCNDEFADARVLKGGSCYSEPENCLISYKKIRLADYHDDTTGLRLVLVP